MAANQPIVLKTGVAKNTVNPDLNFRLRLDISGANVRIADKLMTDEETGRFWVDRESGLDMDFDIVKTDDNRPNESTITIWNLSNDTYELISSKGDACELYAAWGKDEYALMFRGYPLKALKKGKDTILTSNQGFLRQDANATRRGQNDIETVLTMIDGKAQYEEATINKEYKNEVSTRDIVKDLIETFGIPIGSVEDIGYTTKRNYTARGKSVKILNELSKEIGFNWSINNGIFYLYTDKEPQQPYGIVLYSENSSTPERQNDKFKVKTKTIQRANKKKGIAGIKETSIEKTYNGYMITTRLLPFLNPGVYCQCDFGKILQGVKRIYKVRHRGNNYGTVAETEVYVV